MTPLPWNDLMRLGLVELGLAPDVFWNLTPMELVMIAGLGGQGTQSITRSGFEELLRQFPDKKESS